MKLSISIVSISLIVLLSSTSLSQEKKKTMPWVPLLLKQGQCVDNDGDGYGNPASPKCTFPLPDCDNTNPDINPGAKEVCDGLDNNCEQGIDEEPAASDSCTDGLWCTGTEFCNEVAGCLPGTPPNCSDGCSVQKMMSTDPA